MINLLEWGDTPANAWHKDRGDNGWEIKTDFLSLSPEFYKGALYVYKECAHMKDFKMSVDLYIFLLLL